MTGACDLRDWFIMACITTFSSSLVVYIFKHPDPASFAAACAALPTMVGLYHWFNVKDNKTADAG